MEERTRGARILLPHFFTSHFSNPLLFIPITCANHLQPEANAPEPQHPKNRMTFLSFSSYDNPNLFISFSSVIVLLRHKSELHSSNKKPQGLFLHHLKPIPQKPLPEDINKKISSKPSSSPILHPSKGPFKLVRLALQQGGDQEK